METSEPILQILKKYLQEIPLNEQEQELLNNWQEADARNKKLFFDVQQQLFKEDLQIFDSYQQNINHFLHKFWAANQQPIPIIHTKKRSYLSYAAAIILLAGLGTFLWSTFQNDSAPVNNVHAIADIPPGTNRAILTINSDTSINLATNKTGINISNAITYNDGERIADAGKALQLSTPRGGQYQAILPDGTKVWLNAASSIKIPADFNRKERRAEVTGEVYFEVATNPASVFLVTTGKTTIQVLGTSFNINAYPDEKKQRASLISGAVKILADNSEAVLKPGEVAVIQNGVHVSKAQVEQDIAWTNGLFNFEGASLEEVMRQLERWYDIDVEYESIIPNIKFGGFMSRNMHLSGLLKVLEASKVHYRFGAGNKLIITP